MENKTIDIFEKIKDFRDEYVRLSLDALKDGLSAIKYVKESGNYIGNYYEFPNLSMNKNGFPNLSTNFGSGPVDYRQCFNSHTEKKPFINEQEIESFNKLVELVRNHEALRQRFTISTNQPTESNIEIDRVLVILGIKDNIERYIHNYQNFSYMEDVALMAIAPTISYIFDRDLNIDIFIPILFLNFNFDKFELSENIRIEKISELQHKARFKINSYNVSAHRQVINSATHALVLKKWSIPNSACMWNFNGLSQARTYPIEQIDQFFAALRINSSADTGYAQVYAVAQGWAASCTANLPYVEGVTLRAYPSWFEDYYWNNEEFPLISENAIVSIKEIFNQIQSAKENAIKLALKRLNRCVIRDDEEDAILDATIALEALLSDGNQEMTHKLALRVAALLKLEENPDWLPSQAFSDIKKIYSFRSEIVHGSKNLGKQRTVKTNTEKTVSAHILLIEYLKMTLKFLLKNEKYRDPKNIDQDILLG